jgi:hypothetical protein
MLNDMKESLSPDNPVFPIESVASRSHVLRHNQLEVDIYKLVHLTQEIPETTIPVEKFLNGLNDQCWSNNNGKIISPQEVVDVYRKMGNAEGAIAARPEFSEHIQQIEDADCSFPVLVFESRVVDGMHRFVKAILRGQTSIQAKIINEMPEAAIINRVEAVKKQNNDN